jgi:uncharacterized membrane protein
MQLEKETIYQGEDTKLEFELSNVGLYTLTDVRLNIELPPEFGGAKNITIPTLAPNTPYSTSMPLQSTASTPLGKYAITGTAYMEGLSEKLGTKQLTVADWPITTETSLEKSSVAAGDNDSLSVIIKNRGGYDLENVLVSLKAPFGFKANVTTIDFGSLSAVTKQIENSIPFAVSSAAQTGDYRMTLEITFTDEFGNHTYTRDIPINVPGGFSALETILMVLIVVVILVILYEAMK